MLSNEITLGLEKLWWDKMRQPENTIWKEKQKQKNPKNPGLCWKVKSEFDHIACVRKIAIVHYCNTIVRLNLTVTEWTDPSLLGLSNPQKWSTNQTAGFIRCVSVTLYPM